MITLQLLQQIIVFFLMMSCGFTVVKCGLIDAKSSRTLSVICIYIIMPCVMINAFQIEYSRSIRNGFLLAVAAAILIHIFLLVFVQIIGKPLKLSVVEKESIIYSNSGNLVIPLVTVVLGEKWVIYASAFLSVQMILMWTHGQSLMEAKAGINWKNPLQHQSDRYYPWNRSVLHADQTAVDPWKHHEPDFSHPGTCMYDHAWNDHDGGKMERYFQPFQDLSDHDLENGGDSAAHTVVFEVSALGFNGKGWKNHSAYQSDGSDHTVGNNGCTAGTALRSGPGLCQHHQCNDNAGKYHNHATDGHVVSCLSISGNRYG